MINRRAAEQTLGVHSNNAQARLQEARTSIEQGQIERGDVLIAEAAVHATLADGAARVLAAMIEASR